MNNLFVATLQEINFSDAAILVLGPLFFFIPVFLFILYFKRKNEQFTKELLLPMELQERRDFKLKAVKSWYRKDY